MNGKVCAKCNVEMYPKKNGVFVLEYAGHMPYKIWSADLWACRSCGAEIVLGFPRYAIVEHYEPHFLKVLESIKEKNGTLIDCFEKIPAGKDE